MWIGFNKLLNFHEVFSQEFEASHMEFSLGAYFHPSDFFFFFFFFFENVNIVLSVMCDV